MRCENPRLDLRADASAGAERRLTVRDVEKRFIERQAFHERRELVEDIEHDFRDGLVAVEARPHANRVRTALQRFAHRHRRMHAELAHLIARRRDDAATAESTDDQRLAAQFRIVERFHGRIERIHVDVEDGA